MCPRWPPRPCLFCRRVRKRKIVNKSVEVEEPKKAFEVFCKLTNLNYNSCGDEDDSAQNCYCEACAQSLEELSRLQKIIEECQVKKISIANLIAYVQCLFEDIINIWINICYIYQFSIFILKAGQTLVLKKLKEVVLTSEGSNRKGATCNQDTHPKSKWDAVRSQLVNCKLTGN